MLGFLGCGCLGSTSKHLFRVERIIEKNPYLFKRLVLPATYQRTQQQDYRTLHNGKIGFHNRLKAASKFFGRLTPGRVVVERKLTDDINHKYSKILTIPNVLTGFRLLAAPYIGYLVFCQDFNWALGLFFLAAATDSVDGWIARNIKGQSSILGSYIDPLADKMLVSILTFSLTYVGIIPIPLCVMIIMRDVMIMTSAAHFHYKHLEPPKTLDRFFDFENSKVQMEPTQISKYNTFLQLGLVAFSLSAPVFDMVGHPYLQAYWYLVASTTVLSGLSYVVKDKSAYFVK